MKTAATAGIMLSAGTVLLGHENMTLVKDMQSIRLPQFHYVGVATVS